MPRVVSVVLVVLVVVLCLACGGAPATKFKASRSATADKAEVADIRTAIVADKVAAEKKYSGKTVEITGTVYEASSHKEDGPFAILESGGKGSVVSCWFHKSREKEVLALKKGKTVRVAGVVTYVHADTKAGEFNMTLEDCALVD